LFTVNAWSGAPCAGFHLPVNRRDVDKGRCRAAMLVEHSPPIGAQPLTQPTIFATQSAPSQDRLDHRRTKAEPLGITLSPGCIELKTCGDIGAPSQEGADCHP
jgi:hypothetical protein